MPGIQSVLSYGQPGSDRTVLRSCQKRGYSYLPIFKKDRGPERVVLPLVRRGDATGGAEVPPRTGTGISVQVSAERERPAVRWTHVS